MSLLQKKLIFKKYRIVKVIYKTKKTTVYEGINELTKEHVAMKCEKIGGEFDILESEAYTLL